MPPSERYSLGNKPNENYSVLFIFYDIYLDVKIRTVHLKSHLKADTSTKTDKNDRDILFVIFNLQPKLFLWFDSIIIFCNIVIGISEMWPNIIVHCSDITNSNDKTEWYDNDKT